MFCINHFNGRHFHHLIALKPLWSLCSDCFYWYYTIAKSPGYCQGINVPTILSTCLSIGYDKAQNISNVKITFIYHTFDSVAAFNLCILDCLVAHTKLQKRYTKISFSTKILYLHRHFVSKNQLIESFFLRTWGLAWMPMVWWKIHIWFEIKKLLQLFFKILRLLTSHSLWKQGWIYQSGKATLLILWINIWPVWFVYVLWESFENNEVLLVSFSKQQFSNALIVCCLLKSDQMLLLSVVWPKQ